MALLVCVALSFNEFIDNILNSCVYTLFNKIPAGLLWLWLEQKARIYLGLYIGCICGLGWDFIIYTCIHYLENGGDPGGYIAADLLQIKESNFKYAVEFGT